MYIRYVTIIIYVCSCFGKKLFGLNIDNGIRRVYRGEPGSPPPLEIEKQKKKVIRANFKLFHLYFLYFATFFVENIIFFPPEKFKSKKKGFQILGPPLTNSCTRAWEYLKGTFFCSNEYSLHIIEPLMLYCVFNRYRTNCTYRATPAVGGRSSVF